MRGNQMTSTSQNRQRGIARRCFIALIVALLVGVSIHTVAPRKVHADTKAKHRQPKMGESKRLPVLRSVQTASGRISYMEQGTGAVALYVHGVLLNSYLWRHQLEGLSDIR